MSDKVGHFDICKAMAITGSDIRFSGLENVSNLRKVKAGTQVTIGVAGDVVAAIGIENRFFGGLLLCDKDQYRAATLRLNQVRDADTPATVARRIVSTWIDPKSYSLQPEHEAELQRSIASAIQWALDGATEPYTEGYGSSGPVSSSRPAKGAAEPAMAAERDIERCSQLEPESDMERNRR